MKALSFLALLSALSCSGPRAAAQASEPSEYNECVADRLTAILCTATFIEQKAASMDAELRTARPPLKATVAEIKRDAQDIQVQARAGLGDTTATAKLESALTDTSVALAGLHATVGGLALDLSSENYPAAFTAVTEMGAKLDELRQTVPADEPARGCK